MNDCLFKTLMCHPNSRIMVVDFLNSITGIEKEKLEKATYISGEEIPKRIKNEKRQITDLTVKINNNLQIIIEMNQNYNKNIYEKNTMYAFSKTIEYTTKNTKRYPKIILVNIDNFNRFKTKKAILEFKIRDIYGHIETEMYNSIHLVLENIINSKYNIEKEIKKFGEFLKERDIKELEEKYKGEEKYMAAIRTVEELSKDPEFAGFYDLEEAHRQEIEDTKETYKEEGLKEGVKEGIREGILTGAKNIAIKLLKEMDPLKVCEITGLSMEEINYLKK